MRFSESEIVDDMLEHIREAGGEFREWRVGTANGIQNGRFKIQAEQLGGFKIQDELGNNMPELAYREAYTTFAAEYVVERLTGFGLLRERDTARNQAANHPGKTVFVYRPIDLQKAEGSPQKAESCEPVAAR